MLKKLFVLAFVLSFFVVSAAPVLAAPAAGRGGNKPGGGGGGGTTVSTIGYDISYPQCGKTIQNGAFGIVGVNNGRATEANPCFADQLAWAFNSSGSVASQPKAQLYVNTANPGEVLEQYAVDTWPTSNIDTRGNDSFNNADPLKRNPYGQCTTTSDPAAYNGYVNDMACSWQYGWNRMVQTVDEFFANGANQAGQSADPADYVWWLDVETMNSWQGEAQPDGVAGRDAKVARNTATLEAMKSFLDSVGVEKVGIYSTGYQWGRIVGNTISGGVTGQNLNGLDSWLAGARSEKDARSRCTSSAPLTAGGNVALVQYVSKNLDHNVACQ